MPIITISKAAHDAFLARASDDFVETGRENPDGTWNVPFSDDTLRRLNSIRQEGETYTQVIDRLVLTKQ